MSKAKGGRSLNRKKDRSLWWVIGVAVGVTAALIVASNVTARRLGEIVLPSIILTDQERGADRHVLGSADAPVELVEFSDFRCPHCRESHEILGSQIEELVAEGTARYVRKHMLVIDPSDTSLNAAEAVECAADQGYYWAFLDMLFANQAAQGQKWTRDAMKTYARELGLDTKAFNECMDQQKYRDKVLADSAEGYSTPGITGTPSFLVNGELLRIRSYQDVISAVLAAAGQSAGQGQ
jgi:protein-disulfide isomerase